MGTVFEIGYAKGYATGKFEFSHDRFVIAYSVQHDASVGFNLMITEAVDGFATSPIELEALLLLIEEDNQDKLAALKAAKQIPLSEI